MAGRRQQVNRKRRSSELAELRIEVRSGFAQMHAGFKEFRGQLAALDDKVDSGFARVDARLDRVERDLDTVKSDLQIVKHDLTLVKQDVGRLQLAVTEHGRQLKLVRPVTGE